ncbi:tetratricopeptide repeat protein [Sphaerotilaceae bacterium SBD11-9]
MQLIGKWACVFVLGFACAGVAAQESPYTLSAMSKLTCEQLNDKIKEGQQLGDPEAFYSAAQLLIRRVCFRYSPKAHVTLLQKAVEMGHEDASEELGYAYALGEGVPQSYQAAGELLLKSKRARLPGHSDAYTLGYTWSFARLVRRNTEDMTYTWRYEHLLLNTLKVDPLATSTISTEYQGTPAAPAQAEAAEALRRVTALMQDSLKKTLRGMPPPDKARLKDEPLEIAWGFHIVTEGSRDRVNVESVDSHRPH